MRRSRRRRVCVANVGVRGGERQRISGCRRLLEPQTCHKPVHSGVIYKQVSAPSGAPDLPQNYIYSGVIYRYIYIERERELERERERERKRVRRRRLTMPKSRL